MIVVLAGRLDRISMRDPPKSRSNCWAADRSFAITPDVPVAMRGSLGGFRIDEPLVLIGSMVHDEIEDEVDVAVLGFANQAIEIFQCSVLGSMFS